MIAKKPIKCLAILAIVFSSLNVFAGGGEKQSSDNDGGKVNTKEEITRLHQTSLG